MKHIIIITALILSLAACDQPTDSKSNEKKYEGGTELYRRCHEHETYGAHIGPALYCMVPLDRMDEMSDNEDILSTFPHIGWYCLSIRDNECILWEGK